MNLSNPYLRLMRLHQPVGILLLFWPCAWAVLLASSGNIDVTRLLLFFLGAVLMRSAGCIVNDIADRDIDKHVERTRTRPLASGELSIKQAIKLLILLLLASLMVALQLGLAVVMWGALALLPIVIYPFMKRISWWPQLFLGLVFNWGALMGWVAVRGQIELPAILLYLGGVCWTLGYDTIYAHQDKIDDAKIGIRSSALRLGDNSKIFISIMYALAITLFVTAAGSLYNLFFLIPAALHCAWQVQSLDINTPKIAKKIFLSNLWLGFIIFLGLFFSLL